MDAQLPSHRRESFKWGQGNKGSDVPGADLKTVLQNNMKRSVTIYLNLPAYEKNVAQAYNSKVAHVGNDYVALGVSPQFIIIPFSQIGVIKPVETL